METLPKLRDQIEFQHIDGTPDGGYALRILKAYRQRCNEKWILEGFDKDTVCLYELMNKHQDIRAKELDKAIRILQRYNYE